MRPKGGLNPTAVVSSDSIIWQGSDIPCINLCHGDSITKVVHKLATKLCNLLDSLNVENYDIECLNVTGCPPETLEELIQLIIDSICNIQLLQGDPGVNGNYITTEVLLSDPEVCPNGGLQVNYYDGVTDELLSTATICNGLDGENGLNGTPCQGCVELIDYVTVRTTGEISLNTMSDVLSGNPTGEWYLPSDYGSPSLVDAANLVFTAPEDGLFRFGFCINGLYAQASDVYMAIGVGINGSDPSFSIPLLIHPETIQANANSFDGFIIYGADTVGEVMASHTFVQELEEDDVLKVYFYNIQEDFFIDANPLIRMTIEQLN